MIGLRSMPASELLAFLSLNYRAKLLVVLTIICMDSHESIPLILNLFIENVVISVGISNYVVSISVFNGLGHTKDPIVFNRQ